MSDNDIEEEEEVIRIKNVKPWQPFEPLGACRRTSNIRVFCGHKHPRILCMYAGVFNLPTQNGAHQW